MHFSTKPRHVTPQIDRLGKMNPLLMVTIHISDNFYGDRWENIHFSSKPRHVTPQINCLGKTSPALMVSTHNYGVAQEIVGKTFIFQVNLDM